MSDALIPMLQQVPELGVLVIVVALMSRTLDRLTTRQEAALDEHRKHMDAAEARGAERAKECHDVQRQTNDVLRENAKAMTAAASGIERAVALCGALRGSSK